MLFHLEGNDRNRQIVYPQSPPASKVRVAREGRVICATGQGRLCCRSATNARIAPKRWTLKVLTFAIPWGCIQDRFMHLARAPSCKRHETEGPHGGKASPRGFPN